MIRFACSCGFALSAPESCAGQSSKCRQCGRQVTVPPPAAVPVSPSIYGFLDFLAWGCAGMLFSVVISYYFQPGWYRFTVSLGGYFSDLPIILTRPDQPYEESYVKTARTQMRTTVILVALVFSAIGAAAGYWLQWARRRWMR